MPIGSRKELRKLKRKVEMLEAQVEELSRKIEAQENKKIRIGKIVSLTAEILTIIAGIVAIVELFMLPRPQGGVDSLPHGMEELFLHPCYKKYHDWREK